MNTGVPVQVITMSSNDSKKLKKRKTKKGVKTAADLSDTRPVQQQIVSSSNIQDLREIEQLMDAGEDDSDAPIPPLPRGSNPYLGGERCLLCRCERPDQSKSSESNSEEADEADKSGMGGLAQLPLWVCPDCRKTVEEEEKRAESILDPDLRLDTPNMQFLGMGSEPSTPNGTLCTCEACTERRQIEAEHEKETQELQQCWMELRHVVRCVYRQAGTGLTQDTTPPVDAAKMLQPVHRLCSRDCHQLYQRLESQGREFVIEMKVRLLKQLTSGHKTPTQAKQFVCMLLEEYSHLCAAASILASFLGELESEHLKRFNVTWELHNKHLFQSIIYTDPLVKNSLPVLITQLRLGAASKEAYHEDTYPNILHRYLKFDEQMKVVSTVWRDCHQKLEDYNQEQAALKAKQKMLKEDWEFFKAQRKILEQQVLKYKTTVSSHSSLDAQFKQTMRQLFQGPKPNTTDDCHCQNCNRKRCPCDECTISHMITCGILNTDVTESLPSHQAFAADPSRYIIDVTPPSMSSTTSSSGSSSPITVDQERLALPFDDCPENFELPDDGIPEELDDDDDCSDKSNSDEDEEEEEDESNTEDVQEDLGEDLCKDQDASADLLDGPGGQDIQNCDCSHCTAAAATAQPQPPAEENPCQCHACLQQSGAMLQTSLPQALPASVPRPAALHLYPHIHGANTLHARLHPSHNATSPAALRPLLPPHLYDLHTPIHQQPKRMGVAAPPPHHQQQQHKVRHPFNLDIDTHEALHEHIYHAYGEWDNPYDDTKLMLSSHGYGGGLSSELLPPPPLVTNPFSTDALSMTAAGGGGIGGSDMCTVTSSVQTSSLHSSTSFLKASTTASMNTTDILETPPCFKNLKPINRTLLSPSRTKLVSGTSSASLTSAPGGKAEMSLHMDTSHSPNHKNPFLYTHHSSSHPATSPTATKATVAMATTHSSPPSHPPLPMKLTPDLIRSAANVSKDSSSMTTTQSVTPMTAHACNHAHNHGNMSGIANGNHNQQLQPQVYPPPGGATVDQAYSMCKTAAAAAAAAGNMNNVSVGTSMVCGDGDYEGHHDENYDSGDDSCSEQSSSTSTSNQKDGKYCDCCYCEFFGHSTPPVAPTSRNYPEMREKLRLRLKKKNEQKGDEPCTREHHLTKQQQDELETRGLDELIRYINGTDDSDAKTAADKASSNKAAKRARQKQRKAEERARQEEEERIKALQAEEEARQLAVAAAAAQKLEAEKNQNKKKKGKHRDSNKDATASPTASPRQQQQQQNVLCQQQHQRLQHNPNGTPAPPTAKKVNHKKSAQNGSVVVETHATTSKPSSSCKPQTVDCAHVRSNSQASSGQSNSKSLTSSSSSSLSSSSASSASSSSSLSSLSSASARQTKSSSSSPSSSHVLHPHMKVTLCNKLQRQSVGQNANTPTTAVSKMCPQQQMNRVLASQAHAKAVGSNPATCKNGVQDKVVKGPVAKTAAARPQEARGHADGSSSNNPPQSPRQQHRQQQLAASSRQQHQNETAHQVNGEQMRQLPASVAPQPQPPQQERNKRMKHQLQAQHSNGTPSKVSRNNMINQHQHRPPAPPALPNTTQTCVRAEPVGAATPAPPSGHNNNNNKKAGRRNQQQQPIEGTVPSQITPKMRGFEDMALMNGFSGLEKVAAKTLNHIHASQSDRLRAEKSGTTTSSDGQVNGCSQNHPVSTTQATTTTTTTTTTKSRSKKKKKSQDEASSLDEIFLPKQELDLENGDLDESEKELEMFKRFCHNSKPQREKLQVNVNIKDIFTKKKSGVSCA